MKRIILTMNEDFKYQIIKELVDHNGNKARAALKLNLSTRQINRLIKNYHNKGKAAFVHGNKGRKPVNCLTTEINNKIVTLYRTKYQDFNFMHFTQMLNELEGIKVSYSTVYSLLSQAQINSPKIWRKTKKNRAKAKKKLAQSKELPAAAVSHEIPLEDAHPRHERKKYIGEEIQMDASEIVWFGNKKASLHLAIDNASGMIVGAYFDWQETLNGYYHVFKQILEDYGIPLLFKTDNRTVFNYESKSDKSEHKDVLTQFGYACKSLGVDLTTTSVSQAKGQVERANQTFQGRLPQELRINQITTIDRANKYLREVFVPNFNKQFGTLGLKSVFETSPSSEKINYTLAVLALRKFDSGSAIKYLNKYYQALNNRSERICFMKGTKALVINAFDGQKFVSVDNKIFALEEIQANAKTSPEIDFEKPKKARKKYIPPMSHPWKHTSFVKQQKKAHQYHQYV